MTNALKTEPVAGLEIGTSKICIAVAEQVEGGFNLLGLGQSRSRGVRKGEIIAPAQVEEDVRDALSEAEQMADVKIRSVFLGVTGGHLCRLTHFEAIKFSSCHEISANDIEQWLNRTPAVKLPDGYQIIHNLPQRFVVNGKNGGGNPIGTMASRMRVVRHVIYGHASRLQKTIHLLHAMNLNVDCLVFNGIAASQALLTPEDKASGALVIDLGGGATEFVVYIDGLIQLSGVLPVGGDHVSNDLAYGLKIPLNRAEKLKVEQGSALVTDQAKFLQFFITNEYGVEIKPDNVEYREHIMSVRVAEIFEFIARQLKEADLTDWLRAGVFLCGGGARTPGILSLAKRIFPMKVALGRIRPVGGLSAALDQPEFATAIGLAQYGLPQNRPGFETIPPPPPLGYGDPVPLPMGISGRFSNTVPALYDGEDLDVPTFVRQGDPEITHDLPS